MDTPDQFESLSDSSADDIPARFRTGVGRIATGGLRELLARRERLLRAHPDLAEVSAQYLRDVDAMNNRRPSRR